MILVNGEQTNQIDIADRGLQYGDGLFETIEVVAGLPVFFEQHLKRLQAGADKLGIPFPEQALLHQEVKQLAKNQAKAVVKIILTRGTGGRGYKQPEKLSGTRIIALYDFPEYPPDYYSKGVNVRLCHYKLGINPYLAGIKHLNRLEQVLARAEWSEDDIQEGLMCAVDGRVIEATMSNLFIIKDQQLLTPIIDTCGVAGIIRQLIVEGGDHHHVHTKQTNLLLHDIYSADELFICNSIIGIWPIRQIDRRSFERGPITQKLKSWLTQLKKLKN